MAKFVIEHLEPKLYRWCFLEYRHISKLVGRKNLIFTNIKSQSARSKLQPLGKISPVSIARLGLEKICILDPEAKNTLTPQEAKKFSYFVFGGILGDYPPKQRTKTELKLKGERRNIGKEQFPTDNAIYVVKKIASGTPLNRLKFQDCLAIPIKNGEEVELPFRYILVNNKPLISRDIVAMLKMQKGF
jgi:ribosome biogenesis SPOUT family RNA methylase Rps3